ncbi:MAG: UDP-2,3-diacylglucosamine diphosphatase [Pseudomonadota bacterium]
MSDLESVPEPTHYRTIWISDVHLGTRSCNAAYLLDFLKHTESETLYLVGDIIDGWQLKKNWYWPQLHNDVVQKLLRKARKGTNVIYLPGNHDEFVRPFVGHDVGNVSLVEDCVHTTAQGKRFLVLHGDKFDGVVKYARWLALLGDKAYQLLLLINVPLNAVRRRLGFSYWSLSAYLKMKTKRAVSFISDFETALSGEAARQGLDGVICGHIHTAEMKDHNGLLYVNDGDWVESCTALVEDTDGNLHLLNWAEQMARRTSPSVATQAA